MDANGDGKVDFAEFNKVVSAFELGSRTSADAIGGQLMQRLNGETLIRGLSLVSNPSGALRVLSEQNGGGVAEDLEVGAGGETQPLNPGDPARGNAPGNLDARMMTQVGGLVTGCTAYVQG